MNCLKKLMTFSFLAFVLNGCGVKGDPLPPERPADIGRGRPNYRRATENLPVRSKAKGANSSQGEEDDSQ